MISPFCDSPCLTGLWQGTIGVRNLWMKTDIRGLECEEQLQVRELKSAVTSWPWPSQRVQEAALSSGSEVNGRGSPPSVARI